MKFRRLNTYNKQTSTFMASAESKASWCLVDPVSGVNGKIRVHISGTFWAGRLARSTQLEVVSKSKLSATIDVDQIADEQVSVELLQTTIDALQTEVQFKGTSNSPWLKFTFINAIGVEQLAINGKPYEQGQPIVDDPGATGLYSFTGILKLQRNTTAGELSIELFVQGSTSTSKSASKATQLQGSFTYQLVPKVKTLLSAAGESVVCECSYDTYLDGIKIGADEPLTDFYVTSSNLKVFVINTHKLVVGNNTSFDGRSTILTFSQTGFVDATIDVAQEAGKMVYEVPAVNVVYSTMPAGGGTSVPSVAYQQVWTWNGVKDSGSIINKGATIAWSMQATPNFSLNTRNGYVAATNNTSEEERSSEPVLCKVTMNGQSTVFGVVVKQHAGVKMYATPTIGRFIVDDIPASGGSVAAASLLTYTQIWTWNGVKDSGGEITTGAQLSYSDAVTANSLEAIAKPRSVVGQLTVYLTLNNKNANKTVDVYQALNQIESYNEVVCKKFAYLTADGSAQIIPAGGGQSVKPTVELAQGRLWSSGYLETVESDIEIVNFVLAADTHGSFVSIDAKTGVVTANSLGTAYLQQHAASLRLDARGLDGSELSFVPTQQLYQESNYIESFVIDKLDIGWPTIQPNETQSAKPHDITFNCTFTYRSKSVTTAKPDTNVATIEVTDNYELTVGNGFNGVTEEGVILVDDMGTTLGSRRPNKVVVTRTATIVGQGEFASVDKPQSSKQIDVTSNIVQGVNQVSFTDIDVHATYPEVPAKGGKFLPTLLYNQTATYTSGTVIELTTGALVKWSGTNIDATTGEVTAASLGIVATPRQVITTSKIEVQLNGKISILDTEIWQAENKIESWDAPELEHPLTVADIPAKGGSIATGTQTGLFKQHANWSSTDKELHTGVKSDIEPTWGTPVTVESLGTTQKERAKVGELSYSFVCHGVKGTAKVDIYQAANFPNFDSFAIVPVDGNNVIPASGGAITIKGIKHFTWESEFETTEDIFTDFVLQFVGSSAGFGIDMSNNQVKVTASSMGDSHVDARSIQVKATCENIESPAIEIVQAANERTLKSIIATSLTNELPASGSTATIVVEALYAYASGKESTSDVSTIAQFEFAMQSVPAYLSMQNNYVVAANQTNVASNDVEVSLNVTFEDKTASVSGIIVKGNSCTYGVIEGNIATTKQVPASGDTTSATTSYLSTTGLTQMRQWTSGTNEQVTNNKVSITSVSPATLNVPSLADTPKDTLPVVDVVAELEWNGITATKRVQIFQQANVKTITYTQYVIGLTADPTTIACYGGRSLLVKTASRVRTESYTSGTVNKFDEHTAPNLHTLSSPFEYVEESGNLYVKVPDNLTDQERQTTVSAFIANYTGADSKTSITIKQAAYPGIGEMEIGLTMLVR